MQTRSSAGRIHSNGKRRRILLLIALDIHRASGVLWAAYWVLVLSKREQTDDAYVNGNKVVISAQVSGTVIAVLADDTQLVKAGQVLVRLDPIDAQVALSRDGERAWRRPCARCARRRSTADQYDAAIETRKLELARAADRPCQARAAAGRSGHRPEEVRHARESVEMARAALDPGGDAKRMSAHALVDGTQVEDNPAVLQAKAAYRDAWIAAQRNAVVAPVTGYVAERSVQLGQHIQAGQALMTVIPLNSLWVDANFKEVQLRNLRIGQPAEVRSDLYGGSYIFHGHVQGMSAGTGAAFALLPRAKCLGQLDQGGAARAGANSNRRRRSGEVAAARRPVRHRDGGHDDPRRTGAGGACGGQAGGRYPGLYSGSRQGQCRSGRRRAPQFEGRPLAASAHG